MSFRELLRILYPKASTSELNTMMQWRSDEKALRKRKLRQSLSQTKNTHLSMEEVRVSPHNKLFQTALNLTYLKKKNSQSSTCTIKMEMGQLINQNSRLRWAKRVFLVKRRWSLLFETPTWTGRRSCRFQSLPSTSETTEGFLWVRNGRGEGFRQGSIFALVLFLHFLSLSKEVKMLFSRGFKTFLFFPKGREKNNFNRTKTKIYSSRGTSRKS